MKHKRSLLTEVLQIIREKYSLDFQKNLNHIGKE